MDRTKYPRTPHLPWSASVSKDDLVIPDCSRFAGKQVVVTEKMDGECTTVYSDGYVHARSMDSKHHPSRSWVKGLASTVAHELPTGWRICGENLYAFHSILYKNLPSYFFVYGVYNERNVCLPWSEIEDVCQILGLHTVPVLYKMAWDEDIVKNRWLGKGVYPTFGSKVEIPKSLDDFEPCEAEGYVVRTEHGFAYDDFGLHVAKWVRPHHVRTDAHWMDREPFPNILAG